MSDDDNIVDFNPWRDFNGAPVIDAFDPELDPKQIAIFMDAVFGYCEGLIPVRGFIDKGQGFGGKPHNIWIEADKTCVEKMITFANWAARTGTAVYVIPGTVAERGEAKASGIRQMQAIVADLDAGGIAAKLNHLVSYLGTPTLIIESGGRTAEDEKKLHVWWKLTEPAEGEDIALLCRLREVIARKAGADPHFGSAHQPIRVAGTVYHKSGIKRIVYIRDCEPSREFDLREFAQAVQDMPPLPGYPLEPEQVQISPKPGIDEVLVTPVREGGQDAFTRFQGASAAIGHYIRMVHEGRLGPREGWEAICQYNAAMLRPAWPLERLKAEADRLWRLHVERNGPALIRANAPPSATIPAYRLGALLDDTSPVPPGIIAPRLLTPGGMLVIGGAPKVGKSDFLISLLVHIAAGVPFLMFTPPRPLRVFYLQAEIDYHYLRERLQSIRLDEPILAAARDNLVITPKVRMLLNEQGVALVAAAINEHFADAPPDVICIDPIRNLFDGGPEGGGENGNNAMLFFLQERVEALRNAAAPEAGLILCHHTRKTSKKDLAQDPFQALSGASALRGFYTTGIIMHRPDEEKSERRLEFELRNGPALRPITVDKINGHWVEIDIKGERLVRKTLGEKLDAERIRKRDVILQLLHEEALEGRLYTINQFVERFENRAGLGGNKTIRERLGVLTTKGYVKFTRDHKAYDLPGARSPLGYLVVEGMLFGPAREHIDPQTGEIEERFTPVLPTHYKCPTNGALLPVEDPNGWVYHDGDEA
ncbi:MAG TPA: AAA family ATPase [Methylocella sp.]|nr:AAA family ATPase [Methylocella sp.]